MYVSWSNSLVNKWDAVLNDQGAQFELRFKIDQILTFQA